GAGLTWTLVARMNVRLGTTEIWKATAPAVLTNVTVTSTLQKPSNAGHSFGVVAFRGSAGIGASATANAATGQQSVSLTTTKAGSWVWAVGNDWDHAVGRTIGTNPIQTLQHQNVYTATGDTFWMQSTATPTPTLGTVVTINDTAPTNDRWNYT